MLTDNQIEKLIQPVIKRQRQIEMMVLDKIAQRIKDIGTLTPSDVNTLAQLYKSGADVKQLNKRIARLTKLQERDIKKIIRTVAANHYADAEPFYNYRKRSYIPLEHNTAMQSVIKAMEAVTVGTYTNIANSTALVFMWQDLVTGAVEEYLNIAATYQRVVDLGIQAVVTGTTDYRTVMGKIIENLANSGINTVVYKSPSGKVTHQRVDSAVRRNLLDGVRAVSQVMQDEIGKQIGADGVELSVHAMSAPDHEPIQGHQFTEEEYEKCQTQQDFQDVNGQQFMAIARPIGAWNCRHIAYNIIIGVNKPVYTPEQLQELMDRNAAGYQYKDSKGKTKHLSMYECTQKQRQYELAIRKAREAKAMAEQAEMPELVKKYQQRIDTKLDEYTRFSQSCGLKPQYMRTKM